MESKGTVLTEGAHYAFTLFYEEHISPEGKVWGDESQVIIKKPGLYKEIHEYLPSPPDNNLFTQPWTPMRKGENIFNCLSFFIISYLSDL